MSGNLNRAIRLLLVCPLLLLGVPAWRHSHPGGDRPHSAVHDDLHAGMGESHAHLHVTLFGVEFTLPVESDDEDAEEEQTAFLIAASIAIDTVPTSHFVVLAQPILDIGEPLQIVPTFRRITASAAPLCDTARHQRSGVLLI
jgi:hypothetical protein